VVLSVANREVRKAEDDPALGGPDVNVLGSNSRLDIADKQPIQVSIDTEVKRLGNSGHTANLTQELAKLINTVVNLGRTIR